LAAFKEHLPHEPRWPNTGEKLLATDRRIYIATYQTMLNIVRDDNQQLSPHFFDFIVIDESHRSIYNTYGEILDYFKTVTLGLTATPTDIIDHNTFKIFECEDGIPTFAYTYEEAVNNGVIPGKTIFFCSTKAHARRMEEIFDKLYPQYHGELAKVLVSDDPRVYGKGGLLEQFTHNDMPRIAISVDMLDTGIDIRELVNLVFAKPVYSYTKFWQMIGRGTRLLEPKKIKPWCTEKEVFLILDCWDNFEYFKLTSKGKTLNQQIPLPVRLVGLRLEKIEKAINVGLHNIASNEADKLRLQITQLPLNSIVIKEAATALHTIADDNYWTSLNPP
jgi:type I site-specific restriction endonuclease